MADAHGPWRIRDSTRGAVIADRVAAGTSFWQRFMGLMGKGSLPAGEGLYLETSSIHMFFMRFPIDALFVSSPDAEGQRQVLAARHDLQPWRGLVLPVRGAEGVVELPSGTLARSGIQAGTAVRFESLMGAGPEASAA